MPMVTVNSGASNARALPGETGYVPPAEPAADVPVEAAEVPAEPAANAEAQAPAEPVQAVSEPPKAEPKPVPAATPAKVGGGGPGAPDPAVKVTAT